MKARVPPPHPDYIEFLSPFEPQVRALALATRKLVLEEAPDAMELIYDAYNAVATGYSFTGRPSDSFIHIAVYAHWVNLGFNFGSALDDPAGVLQGSGRRIRHIRISAAGDLKNTVIRAFIKSAVAQAERPDSPVSGTGKSVVRAVYPKRRRPATRPTQKPVSPRK